MTATTTIVWLQNEHEDPVPSELRCHVALFTTEDACYQFLCSLPLTLQGLTLVTMDPLLLSTRLIELKSISTVYTMNTSQFDQNKKSSIKNMKTFVSRQSLINQIQTDLYRQKSPAPTFFTGLIAPFQGLLFTLRNSSTRLRALVPALIFTFLLVLCSIGGIWLTHVLTGRYVQTHPSFWKHFGIGVLRVLLYIAVICLSIIIAIIMAQPLSSLALESLVRAQERDLKYPNRPEEEFCSSVFRSIRISLVSLSASTLIFLILVILDLFVPPAIFFTTPLMFIATAFILAYDIIDYPLSLHMLGARERIPWFRQYFWAVFGFGLSMEILFLIPGGFLLFLSAGVCGATRLVVAAERASIDQPLMLHPDST